MPTEQSNERSQYVYRVVALSVFFFECHHEGSVGDSRIVRLLSPHKKFQIREARERFLQDWYGAGNMSVNEAAIALHLHLLQSGRCADAGTAISEAITTACQNPARTPITTHADPVKTAHLRLARYYRQTVTDDLSRHSRAIEYFVPKAFVPSSMSLERRKNGLSFGRHFEHVVPCAFVRENALRYVSEGRTQEDIARMTQRCLVVIELTRLEQQCLDRHPEPLRDVMPAEWDIEVGCIYARLHAKGIQFDPPPERPCTCGYRN